MISSQSDNDFEMESATNSEVEDCQVGEENDSDSKNETEEKNIVESQRASEEAAGFTENSETFVEQDSTAEAVESCDFQEKDKGDLVEHLEETQESIKENCDSSVDSFKVQGEANTVSDNSREEASAEQESIKENCDSTASSEDSFKVEVEANTVTVEQESRPSDSSPIQHPSQDSEELVQQESNDKNPEHQTVENPSEITQESQSSSPLKDMEQDMQINNIDEPTTMLNNLKIDEDANHNQPIHHNNEPEIKQPEPMKNNEEKKPKTSGIRPPTAIRHVAKAPTCRPSTATPKETPKPQPLSSRSTSRMSREPSEVRKSTSNKSINNVGRTTPKVNAKFINVKSKVGSITNHKPGGGNVEIFSEKKEYVAKPKVGSLEKANHVPGGGNVKIENKKLDFSNASSKVGSKTNYTPKKSEVKIVSQKLDWNAKSKVGSLENATHKPTGGNVQVFNQKLVWNAESKVGSKDNIKHKPGGGNVQIFDEKIRFVSRDSSRNHSTVDISSL